MIRAVKLYLNWIYSGGKKYNTRAQKLWVDVQKEQI